MYNRAVSEEPPSLDARLRGAPCARNYASLARKNHFSYRTDRPFRRPGSTQVTDKADLGRRHFLMAATVLTGGVGVAATAVPFVASFRPSARAQALGAPVEVDIGKLEPGAYISVEWRGRAIMVVRRTDFMLGALTQVQGELADPTSDASLQPTYATNDHRSIRPEILVARRSARTSAAPRQSDSTSHPQTSGRTGLAVSTVPATGRSLTWPGAFIEECRLPRISAFLPIAI